MRQCCTHARHTPQRPKSPSTTTQGSWSRSNNRRNRKVTILFFFSCSHIFVSVGFMCEECEKNQAEYQCVECKSKLCGTCEKEVHLKKTLIRHTRTPLNTSQVDGNLCLKHNKEIDLFCVDCSRALCSHCFMSQDHKVEMNEWMNDNHHTEPQRNSIEIGRN